MKWYPPVVREDHQLTIDEIYEILSFCVNIWQKHKNWDWTLHCDSASAHIVLRVKQFLVKNKMVVTPHSPYLLHDFSFIPVEKQQLKKLFFNNIKKH